MYVHTMVVVLWIDHERLRIYFPHILFTVIAQVKSYVYPSARESNSGGHV